MQLFCFKIKKKKKIIYGQGLMGFVSSPAIFPSLKVLT